MQHLPPHWGTLYELTKLDDQEFEEKIAAPSPTAPKAMAAGVPADVMAIELGLTLQQVKNRISVNFSGFPGVHSGPDCVPWHPHSSGHRLGNTHQRARQGQNHH